MDANCSLNTKQQCIILISVFTAMGDMEILKKFLNEGLETGLTVNEIKEILVQLYAYIGFPRSLNGIHAFMEVMDKRQEKGIKDDMGREASPIPSEMNKNEYGANVRAKLADQKEIPSPSGYQLFVPIIDTFLKEHLFADIFARDILDHQTRELVTISALASMSGTAAQLQYHLAAAMNTGLTETQMKDFISLIKSKVGKNEADIAYEELIKVLHRRAKRGAE